MDLLLTPTYDPCLANAMINEKQMAVTWHVDDLKVSHENPAEITEFANYLAVIYGERLTVHRGLVHGYLGMDLDYTTKGKVGISIMKCVYKILEGIIGGIGCLSCYTSCGTLISGTERQQS